MTQFKEINAFDNLQKVLSDEIAGNFIARLKEIGVPDEKLAEVTDNICYDIASAINTIGDFEVPTTELPAATVDEIMEDDLEFELEEDLPPSPAARQQVKGVLSQDEILKILHSANSSHSAR